VLPSVLCYVVTELFVASHLQGIIPALRPQFFVRDVDHRMPPNDPKPPTNADGIRSRRQRGDFPDSAFNVLLLGDSFVYGYHLSFDETIPALVEQRLRNAFPDKDVRVANFGWTSSSPLLSLRLLREVGPAYAPDLVVYCLDMTDFHDDIKYAAMLDRRGIYAIYDRFPITLTLWRTLSLGTFRDVHDWSLQGTLPRRIFFVSAAPLEQTRPFFRPMMANLAALYELSGQLGARFTLVVFPRSYQYSRKEAPDSWERNAYENLGPYSLEPFRYFEEVGPELPYPVHSLLPAFQRTSVFPTCFSTDPHWNADGARVAAEGLAEILEQEIRHPAETIGR